MATAPVAAAEAERGREEVATEGPQSPAGAASGRPARRAKKPRIDLDDSIAAARRAMLKAQKEVTEARRVARNERRKKQRLVKKASTLSPDDLERIAVLKRCGLKGLDVKPAAPQSAAASSSAGSDQTATAAATAAAELPDDEAEVRSPADEITPGGSDVRQSDRS